MEARWSFAQVHFSVSRYVWIYVLVVQSRLTLCNPMDCSPPGSSVQGILQARILAWVAIPFSRGSSWPRDRTQVSGIAGKFFTICATREAWCGGGGGGAQLVPLNVQAPRRKPFWWGRLVGGLRNEWGEAEVWSTSSGTLHTLPLCHGPWPKPGQQPAYRHF